MFKPKWIIVWLFVKGWEIEVNLLKYVKIILMPAYYCVAFVTGTLQCLEKCFKPQTF